ncbi:MAG: ABC transporter ATP-binding protein [Thermomicrobiales bacterium]
MAESLKLRSVEKRFGSNGSAVTALSGIDLDIASGEFVGIVGPSGCGKSTLLRLLAGLDSSSKGQILLGNQPVAPRDPRCAVMFQEPRLFPWKKVQANVAVGARRTKEKPSPGHWLSLVGLEGFGHCYPYQLSGGMAQRVALARALIGHPEVLLLDEPFGALDALTRMQMQDLLAGVRSQIGATVVMVTHDIDEALYLADRVVIMSSRPGQIVETLTVPRHRQRDRSDQGVAKLRTKILRHFGFEEPCIESAALSYGAAAD